MENKGIFKVWFTPTRIFRIRNTVYDINACFTLSQIKIGWTKLWGHVMFHLVFVDITLGYIKCRNRELALECYSHRKADWAELQKDSADFKKNIGKRKKC